MATKGFVQLHFRRFFLVALLTVTAFALAPAPVKAQTGCTTGACISAGPRLVSVDSTQGPVLNLLLQSLLPGTTVNVSVLDWNALAGADINLNALVTQLGLNLGISDTSQVLATDITLAQLQLAMVQVLQADGQTAAANVLDALPLDVPGLTGQIRLADLLQIDLPQGSLADIDLDVLDLITGSAQLYNFRNVVTTPAPITVDTAALGLAGLANLQLWLQVVEPPVIVCGPEGTSFHTSAIRIKLNVDVVQGFDTQAIIDALNAAGLGLTNISLTADVLRLQLYADVARAEGTITAIDYVAGAVTFQARPGLVNFYVGTVDDSLFFNRSHVVTNADVTPVVINNLQLGFRVNLAGVGLLDVQVPLTVTGRAAATGSPDLQSFTVNAPFPQTRTASSGTVSAGTLIVDLLNNLDIEVSRGTPVVTLIPPPPLPPVVIALPPALASILDVIVDTVEATLQNAVVPVLQPVLTTLLGGVVDNLLALLGISVGNAVFTVEGVTRSCVATLALAKILAPTTDPGRFNLSITQGATTVASVSDVGHNGTTAPALTTPGLSYDLAETAGTGTVLTSYTTTWACTDQDGNAISSGSGTSFNLTAPAAGPDPISITCRITNSRSLQSDVSVSKTDNTATYTPGGSASYVITVSNAGPDAVSGVVVNDTLPGGARLSAPWTCVATGAGSSCPASGGAAGDAAISLSVSLDATGTATITVPVSFSADPAAY